MYITRAFQHGVVHAMSWNLVPTTHCNGYLKRMVVLMWQLAESCADVRCRQTYCRCVLVHYFVRSHVDIGCTK